MPITYLYSKYIKAAYLKKQNDSSVYVGIGKYDRPVRIILLHNKGFTLEVKSGHMKVWKYHYKLYKL